MYFKSPSKSKSGWSLIELMMAVLVFTIAGLALMTIFLFSVRSFAAMTNYAVLNQQSRQAMDLFSSEIRQAFTVTHYASNSTSRTLTILNADTNSVTYTFDDAKQQVRRSCNGTETVLLNNCSVLDFNLFTRPPVDGSLGFDGYTPFDTSTNGWKEIKVIQLAWKTSMSINPTTVRNSENVQTAKVIIRYKPEKPE